MQGTRFRRLWQVRRRSEMHLTRFTRLTLRQECSTMRATRNDPILAENSRTSASRLRRLKGKLPKAGTTMREKNGIACCLCRSRALGYAPLSVSDHPACPVTPCDTCFLSIPVVLLVIAHVLLSVQIWRSVPASRRHIGPHLTETNRHMGNHQ
jgi:hypothetical protein